MKVINYTDKNIILKPYTTSDERDLLLYSTLDLNGIFDLLKKNITGDISKLSKIEKKFIILELRNMSVGELFTFKIKCNKCSKYFEFDCMFDNVLKKGDLTDFKNIKLIDIISDEYQDFTDIDLDELDIMEYDKLIEYIDKHKTKLDFTHNTKCPFCKTDNIIELTDELLINNLSEDTISNFYQVISSIIYFGNYSKLDIDSMLPFERSIYLGLLNEQLKKKKELNE